MQAAIGIHEFVAVSTRNIFPRPDEAEQETLLQLYLPAESAGRLDVGRELSFLFGFAPQSIVAVLSDTIVNGTAPSTFGPVRQPVTTAPEPTDPPPSTNLTVAPNTTTHAPPPPAPTKRPYVVRRGKRYTITPSLSLSLIPQPTTPSPGAPPSPNDQPQYRSVLLSFAFPSQAQRVVWTT